MNNKENDKNVPYRNRMEDLKMTPDRMAAYLENMKENRVHFEEKREGLDIRIQRCWEELQQQMHESLHGRTALNGKDLFTSELPGYISPAGTFGNVRPGNTNMHSDPVFQYFLGEEYRHWRLKSRLEELLEEDETYRRKLELMDKVDCEVRMLPADDRVLVQQLFFEHGTAASCMNSLVMGKTTFYERKRRILVHLSNAYNLWEEGMDARKENIAGEMRKRGIFLWGASKDSGKNRNKPE